MYLVLATALATRVSWQVPFDLAPAASLGDASPWSAELKRVLRTPARPGGHTAVRRGNTAGRRRDRAHRRRCGWPRGGIGRRSAGRAVRSGAGGCVRPREQARRGHSHRCPGPGQPAAGRARAVARARRTGSGRLLPPRCCPLGRPRPSTTSARRASGSTWRSTHSSATTIRGRPSRPRWRAIPGRASRRPPSARWRSRPQRDCPLRTARSCCDSDIPTRSSPLTTGGAAGLGRSAGVLSLGRRARERDRRRRGLEAPVSTAYLATDWAARRGGLDWGGRPGGPAVCRGLYTWTSIPTVATQTRRGGA